MIIVNRRHRPEFDQQNNRRFLSENMRVGEKYPPILFLSEISALARLIDALVPAQDTFESDGWKKLCKAYGINRNRYETRQAFVLDLIAAANRRTTVDTLLTSVTNMYQTIDLSPFHIGSLVLAESVQYNQAVDLQYCTIFLNCLKGVSLVEIDAALNILNFSRTMSEDPVLDWEIMYLITLFYRRKQLPDFVAAVARVRHDIDFSLLKERSI